MKKKYNIIFKKKKKIKINFLNYKIKKIKLVKKQLIFNLLKYAKI